MAAVRPVILAIICIFLSVVTGQSQAFVTNGSASFLGGECYQLTPDASGQAGTFFSQNPIDLTMPFSEQASFFFGCKDVNGADGIVFILTTTNTALGGGGGGLGYLGITPSIAIEYDDYQNGNFGDPASDHMAVISMGQIDHNMATNLVGPINISNIEDCEEHCFFVDWNPVTQTLTAVLDDNTISYTGNIINTIFSGNSSVYYGFSSGTGGLSNIHRVCFGPPELMPMEDVSVCEEEGVTLEADPNGIAWTWELDPTLSAFNISDPTATPDVTTTYRVEIEYTCGFFNYDTVVVTVLPLPDAEASNDGPVCIGETIHLSAEGGTSYEWSGPSGYVSFSSDPTITNVTPDDGGTYFVTVTDAAGCSSTSSTVVVIDEGPDITIDPVPNPICDNLDPFQLTASPSGGVWDGEISPGGLFDPEYAEEGIHLISYTVSNALGCFNTAEISIEVLPAPDVVINPPGPLCVAGSPVQLTGSPSGGIWEGEITLGGIFDPADAGVGTHIITYTAEDSDGCSNSEQISIEVVLEQMADISPQGPFCGSDTITLTANPPGGIWGGVANANGQILPNTQSEGSHPVTYQLNGVNECYNTEISIDIVYADVLQCPNGPQLCTNADPVTLIAQPPGGVWSGAADSTGLVDPSTLTPGLHMAVYTDSDLCNSGNSCWTYVEVFDAPSISNVSLDCDAQAAFYTVSFSIMGGDTSSFIVTGTTSGTIIPGVPYTFESDPIPTGNTYTFIVDDINHCFPDTITGTHLCNCTTNAGIMDLNPLVACTAETIQLLPPTGVILDPDDSLVYVLHLGFPDSILLVSDSLAFHFTPPLLPGTTYYVSSVAGNASSGIGVDLNDPCLSVSLGTPVMWVAEPSGGIGGTATICEGDSATLTFFLTGTGPFDVTYSDGSNSYFLNDITPGYALRVLPSVTTTYTLTDIAETIPPACIGYPGTTHTVEVFQNYLIPRSAQICFGDSLLVGGGYQQVGGIYYDSLSTAQGCDSVLVTTLTINTLDTTYQTDKTCDPLQTGVFTAVLTDLNGCDSTIITTVTFALVDTTLIQSSTCDQQAAGIFSNLLAGQDGCDSLVIETITYLPPDSTWISGTTCVSADAGTFITVEMNEAGCDSFIIETILLIPSDTTMLAGETCDPASAGVFMQTFVNVDGCDSLVIETIALLPSDTIVLLQETCFPQDVGTEELMYTNIYGCDSLLQTITSLAPPDSCLVPVIHREIFIPNIFSPNGDGINDQFFISSHPEAIANIPFMRVYDRWGGLVFEGIGLLPNLPSDGWDGKVDGEHVNPGVFAWVAEVEYGDGLRQTLYGDVSLVR